MNVRYVVTLSADERRELEALVSGGAKLVRVAKRAQILLAAADGETDERISKLVRVGTSTVYRTKRRCVEEGIEEAVHDRERAGGTRKLSVKEAALLVATACCELESIFERALGEPSSECVRNLRARDRGAYDRECERLRAEPRVSRGARKPVSSGRDGAKIDESEGA